MLYWAKNDPPNSYSLTGNDDTLLSNPIVGDNLALGDLWIVGSDTQNKLYAGSGHVKIIVHKMPSGDLLIDKNPELEMIVEDMFDFNYWNGVLAPPAAASIQCAFGQPNINTGVGQVALLRFEVDGPLLDEFGQQVTDFNPIVVPKNQP